MEYTQVLVSESFDIKNTATEKIPVATLLIEDEYHTIYNTENVIGREKTCDIVISNNAVSSKHAVIEAEDSDAHLIYDLGSTNKTKLGKMVLKPHVRYHINDGDSVTFGNVSAQYNISRKYLTTPVKGNTTLNSCSIPETPERLVSTLELDATESTKQKVESSALELSDTDLFDEKEADTNLYLKEIPSSPSKPSNDIYELDTLSFDEHIENHVKKTDHLEDLNKINVIPANNDVEEKGFDIDPQELGHDEKPVSKSPPMHDKDKTKTNFGWEDFPEITSHVELDSSSANNLVHSKSKVSSSFLDITNDDLKPDQHIPKNIGGVILSDLCKPACIDSDKQDVSSTSKDGELKIVDETEKGLLSEKTYIEPKTPGIGGTKDSLYLENDCYIPMSQNIDMFEESPEKTDERPEQGDVYEMLTQVSIENKEVNNSIYDIQTQMVIADNDSESKVDKENESISITSPNTKLSMLLESASQPAENNDKEEMNNTSYLKTKVIDETDNNCSFSESIYEAETQPFLQKVSKEPISEISNCLPERMDKNGSVTSAIVVTTQPCIHGSLEIQDSTSSEINNKADEKENLSTTIIGRTTQLCPVEISIDPSKQSHSPKAVVNVDDTEIKISSSSSSVVGAGTKPTSLVNQQLLHEDIESNSSEKISAKDLSICDWYEIATQPCQPTSENVLIEKEIQKNELTKNDDLTDDVFKKEAMQDDKFSTSMYEIATQPCPKDILSENNESINETTLNPELTSMRDDNNTNNNFSNSICEIATQPCPKDIFPEKSKIMKQL
ncbi:unnamed protein product [Nezara viridula]|uniref:FHA domain-containing protein n=1 Tax=Nezara viridula TaxID=85310 RepID=A0A9P0HDA2_NEZVI|nr:unnamed protein product [Nezara viridula]